MNSKFLLILLSFAGFSSCTTAYKTGQTPDDVYYSPVRLLNDQNRTDNNQDKTVYNSSTNDPVIYTRISNRRWRRYQSYDYGYSPYDPCYPGYIDPKTIQTPKYTAPRKVNTGAYKKNTTDNSVQVKTSKTSSSSGTAVGNFMRDVFSGSNNSSNSGNSSGTSGGRTNTNTNSSSSKSSGTNAPVRTFGNK